MTDIRFVSDERCYKCDQLNGPKERELRPYGPGGQPICYECASATPETDAAAMAEFGRQLDAADKTTGVALLTKEGPISYIGPVPKGDV